MIQKCGEEFVKIIEKQLIVICNHLLNGRGRLENGILYSVRNSRGVD